MFISQAMGTGAGRRPTKPQHEMARFLLKLKVIKYQSTIVCRFKMVDRN